MRKLRLIPLVVLVAPILAGCPALDAISGKPSSQEAYERQQLVTTQPAPVLVEAAEEVIVAVKPPAPEPVYVAPPAPPCYEEFRVRRCVDGVAVEWVM